MSGDGIPRQTGQVYSLGPEGLLHRHVCFVFTPRAVNGIVTASVSPMVPGTLPQIFGHQASCGHGPRPVAHPVETTDICVGEDCVRSWLSRNLTRVAASPSKMRMHRKNLTTRELLATIHDRPKLEDPNVVSQRRPSRRHIIGAGRHPFPRCVRMTSEEMNEAQGHRLRRARKSPRSS